MNLKFDLYVPEDMPHTITITDIDADDKPVGWAWVSAKDESGCILHAIMIQENHRGKGYAKQLIKRLQTIYEEIKTQWSTPLLSSAGVQLCIKCGFEIKPIISKKKGGELVWKKSK